MDNFFYQFDPFQMSLHQNQIEYCMLYEFKKSTSAKETEILVMEMFVPANNSLGLGIFLLMIPFYLNDKVLSILIFCRT